MRLKSCVLAAFLALSRASGQQLPQEHPAREYSLSEPRFEKIIVASVGPIKINAREFLMSYEFGPAFPKRETNSKSRYLNFMIYEKLLALDGEAGGLLQTPEATRLLGEIEADLATEELYRDKIASRMSIADARIAHGVVREGQHIRLDWLYARSEQEISAAQRLLRSGISFDSLLARQISDTVKIDDRMMECTRFKLECTNPLLSRVADTLAPGHVSLPIHAPDGWYLVRLTGGWGEAIVTESALAKRREDVHRALVQQVSDSLSDRFVDSLMRASAPVIERKVLDIVEVHLAGKVLSAETFGAWNLNERLVKRWGKAAAGTIDAHGNDILVTMKLGVLRVADLLQWYESREQLLKLPSTSPERFHAAVEQLTWRMVRDRILTRGALQAGLQNRKTVREQKQWWKDKIAFLLEKESLQDSINIPEDTVVHYYAVHPNDFRNDSGAVKPYAEVKDDVRKLCMEEELTKRMLHRVLALKQRYNVTIHDDVLKKLFVDTENQPKAIDVYPVKKGGIFPHRAFPSIDYEWQSWE